MACQGCQNKAASTACVPGVQDVQKQQRTAEDFQELLAQLLLQAQQLQTVQK